MFVYLCDDLSVCLCLCLCLCISKEKDDEERRQFVLQKEERGKKSAKHEINKIMVYTSYNNGAYMHGYCSKCVNIHSFRRIDVEDFGGKMRKIGCFLYFANVYIH